MTIEIDSRGSREGGVDCRVREGKTLGVSKLFNHKSDFWRNSAIGLDASMETPSLVQS